MRTAVPGLTSPHPLVATIPGILQEDSLTGRLLASLDEVLAPVLCTLDNLAAYLDVDTVPDDLLPWLAAWIGLSTDVGLSPNHQREALRRASDLLGWQGTRHGIEEALSAVFGFRAVVQETGGADWSLSEDARLPGEPGQAMVVQVYVPAGQTADRERIDMLVSAVKPAHVVHRLHLVTG
jgi:phage tail-like protein